MLSFKIMCENADALVCVSQAVADEVVYYYDVDPEKVSVVHNGVDTNIFYPRKVEPLREKYNVDFVLLYVGTFQPRKGLKYLLAALKELSKKYRVKLVVIGKDGYYRNYLKYMISKYLVQSVVELLGSVPFFDMPRYLSSADLFVLPSLSEGLPKVLLEAMACGMPSVSSSVSGVPEVIEHCKTGLLVPAADSNSLTGTISYALDNMKSMRLLGRRGMNHVIRNFSWRNAARRCYEVYETVVGN